jgi:vacuolar iron transporter family protein
MPPRKEEIFSLKNYIFGSTAAIITNISLIVGLGSAQTSKLPILGSLLTIALADNISDSLGIHMYKESEGHGEALSVLATVINFLARLLISSSFIGIVLYFPLEHAAFAASAWGLLLLIGISYQIPRENRRNPWWEIIKHVVVAIAVILASHYAGHWITRFF